MHPTLCTGAPQASPAFMEAGYEYLSHTADVQIHSWGPTLQDSFIHAAYGLYDYMTDRRAVNAPYIEFALQVEGDSVGELLLNFLDELLFRFETKPFLVAREIRMDRLDPAEGVLRATCWGAIFDPTLYPCGTEVKAITRSNLQVSATSPYDIYVIVDI